MSRLTTVAALLLLSVTAQPAVVSSQDGSFVTSKPFESIADRQAEAQEWAKCAAVYAIAAELMGNEGLAREQYSNKANGATLAVRVALTYGPTTELLNDPSQVAQDRFNVKWEYSAFASEEWPKVYGVAMLNAVQQDARAGEKLMASIDFCHANLKLQQKKYVDLLRKLAMEGVLRSN